MFIDSILCGIKNIFRKRLRSTLTIMGIAIGVLSVVLISIIGEIGKLTLNSELDSMGIGGLCIRATAGGSSIPLNIKELSEVQSNKAVVAATPLMTSFSNIKVRDKASQSVVWGIDSDTADVVSLELLYGRLINKSDILENAKVCIVDEAFAKQSYQRSNIIGKTISVNIGDSFQPFEIVGVVSSGGNLLQGLMGDIVPTFIYMPYSTASTLSKREGFTQIVAKLKDNADEAQAIASISGKLSSTLADGDSVTVRIENLNQQKDKLSGIVDGATLVLAIIGGISLLVSGLSIMTVMLVTVNERTREIGIKKSIGATNSVILLEFLMEALILSFVGCIIGCIGGISLGAIGSALLGIDLAINAGSVLFCIAFCIVIGILFGVYPATKAAKLKPIDALSNH